VRSALEVLHMSIQGSGEHPAFPGQWFYGLYDFVLVTGFLATIIDFRFRFRQFDASTGASDPNNFAVRKCRARQSLPHVHRSLPLVCDDGQRPLCPESLAECANGRLRTNRPSLELSQ
jgi:hypothetical protein